MSTTARPGGRATAGASARPPSPMWRRWSRRGKINTTDPDSGVMIQKGQPPMQGYNAQAAVTTGQIVIGADVVTSAPDYARLEPVVHGALHDLQSAGIIEKPGHGARRRGVLACRADATPRQQRDAGPRPARQRPTRRQQTGVGMVATTRSCVASSQVSTGMRSTPNASTASSRCSVRSRETVAWTASNEEAGPLCGRNGG